MLRILVDSGSSIKQDEKELYGVEILPMRISIGGKEYLDGVDLDIDDFYRQLIETKEFPKTSLPSLTNTQELVDRYISQGDRVLIITISSEISGTYQTFYSLFDEDEYKDVLVFDSRLAVGGIRFLAQEARRYENESFELIKEKLEQLVSRIVIVAIPETLDYLLAGGRLSKTSWMVGKLLSINPIIGFENGRVAVLKKKRGLKQGMKFIAEMLEADGCDRTYGIVASYSYNKENVEHLIEATDSKYKNLVTAYDNMTPTIGCHWGPNAFGYIYVRE
ncbi:degV family protein [Lachnospiraceae bacterium TWA4]|nr:degV family protein [Lachnospiraceae bacterium TWA4]